MTHPTPPDLIVELNPQDSYGKITVGLEPFLDFGDEITLGLASLVERWQDQAAPAAWLAEFQRERRTLDDSHNDR